MGFYWHERVIPILLEEANVRFRPRPSFMMDLASPERAEICQLADAGVAEAGGIEVCAEIGEDAGSQWAAGRSFGGLFGGGAFLEGGDMETSNYRARSPPGAALASNSRPFMDSDTGHPLAQAIVDTIRDPLLVLDQDLRVVTANRAFDQTFRMNRQDIQGRPVYGLGDGQWDIPELRLLLKDVAPQHAVMEAYEVERDFPIIGRRSMLLSAREVLNQRNSRNLILLTFEDITDRRAAEREITELLQQKETLLQEMQHRVANSLQIIASILLLKARTVQSEETRLHLRDAHQRVMSVAAVQQQLLASSHGEAIEIGPYLSRLCEASVAS